MNWKTFWNWLSGNDYPDVTIPISGPAEPCMLLVGNRGSGKSETLKIESLRIAKEDKSALVAFDLPGSYAKGMVGHLAANGLLDRAWYEPVRMGVIPNLEEFHAIRRY